MRSQPSSKLPPQLQDGIHFECQSSGNCCVSHGEYGYVFLTETDQQLIAKSLRLKVAQFREQYCRLIDGYWALKENPKGPECLFLKEKRCSIYKERPTQCRTWPFWPNVMSAKAWSKNVENFCPGVGQGGFYLAEEIEDILSIQVRHENALKNENVPLKKRKKFDLKK
jgi:Fe-S-cluster containining protein